MLTILVSALLLEILCLVFTNCGLFRSKDVLYPIVI